MKWIHAVVATALVGACGFAGAHGGDTHGRRSGPVVKEQKPWGIAGDAKSVRRTIELTMGDNMRFTPDRIEVRQGEVVRLVLRNQGSLFHEMVIGTARELQEHAALMLRFPDMEHDEPYMAHVKPGTAGEIVWNFNRPGEFSFACLVAGHSEAGMTGRIVVAAASKKGTKS